MAFSFKRIFNKKALAGTLVGLVILIVLIYLANPRDLLAEMRAADPRLIGLYVVGMVISFIFRARRFQLLTPGEVPLTAMWGLVSVHTMLLNLLPFGSGELSYPYLLKKSGSSSTYAAGLPSLIIVRVQDLFVTGILGGLAVVWLYYVNKSDLPAISLSIAGATVLVAGLVLVSVPHSSKLIRFVRPPWLEDFLLELGKMDRGVLFRTGSLAAGSRISAIIATYWLFLGIGLYLPFGHVLLVCCLFVFLPLIPVSPIANVGITEAFLVTYLGFAGIKPAAALAAGLQIHFYQLSICALLSACGYWLLQRYSVRFG